MFFVISDFIVAFQFLPVPHDVIFLPSRFDDDDDNDKYIDAEKATSERIIK